MHMGISTLLLICTALVVPFQWLRQETGLSLPVIVDALYRNTGNFQDTVSFLFDGKTKSGKMAVTPKKHVLTTTIHHKL